MSRGFVGNGLTTPPHSCMYSTANAEQTYFAIHAVKAQRVDAELAVEAASVCGSTSHFTAMLRICPPRQEALHDMTLSRCAL
ncbi:hypothetical protein DPMN_100422 [Dreissena polymorpha]|uniref:Uncharacterized protein n=1 Tax=Dreissena polymorpha TaxID=45954 RepID=A0A9D4R8N1_DREPO|nr:hypothetical protein DPMN_100422 [Dreissena polymorpha]